MGINNDGCMNNKWHQHHIGWQIRKQNKTKL